MGAAKAEEAGDAAIDRIIGALTSVKIGSKRLQEAAVLAAKPAKTKKPLQMKTRADTWVQQTRVMLESQGHAELSNWLRAAWFYSAHPNANLIAPAIKFAKECAACVRTRCHHKELLWNSSRTPLTDERLPPTSRQVTAHHKQMSERRAHTLIQYPMWVYLPPAHAFWHAGYSVTEWEICFCSTRPVPE